MCSHPQIQDDFRPGQQTGNYGYDAIGNLTQDEQEGIERISWTVYGKVQQITKQDGTMIRYGYDASGNRIEKQVVNAEGQAETTYYVRDASGNVMSVYEQGGESECLLAELEACKLYNPSRWLDGSESFGEVKEMIVPEQIAVIEGSSGNHDLTLFYTDEQGTEQQLKYKGVAFPR